MSMQLALPLGEFDIAVLLLDIAVLSTIRQKLLVRQATSLAYDMLTCRKSGAIIIFPTS